MGVLGLGDGVGVDRVSRRLPSGVRIGGRMHMYGDWANERFNEVADAADYIGEFIARWGRIGVYQTKEKFGTARVYCAFGFSSLYFFLNPRGCWVRWKWWPYGADVDLSNRLVGDRVKQWLVKWQVFVFRLAYKRAIKKWPHLRREILEGANFVELLKGL